MIRLTGVYRIETGTFEELDRISHQIMAALMLNDRVIGPDVAVSMDEGTFQVEMVVDTDDPWKASETGAEAMRVAFAAAHVTPPDRTRVVAHRDLLQQTPVKVETVLVDA
jgi:hypothetical protein